MSSLSLVLSSEAGRNAFGMPPLGSLLSRCWATAGFDARSQLVVDGIASSAAGVLLLDCEFRGTAGRVHVQASPGQTIVCVRCLFDCTEAGVVTLGDADDAAPGRDKLDVVGVYAVDCEFRGDWHIASGIAVGVCASQRRSDVRAPLDSAAGDACQSAVLRDEMVVSLAMPGGAGASDASERLDALCAPLTLPNVKQLLTRPIFADGHTFYSVVQATGHRAHRQRGPSSPQDQLHCIRGDVGAACESPDAVVALHRQLYGSEPVAVGCAPGRVNLGAAHTDWSSRHVLGFALDMSVVVAVEPVATSRFVSVYRCGVGARRAVRACAPADSGPAVQRYVAAAR